VKNEETSPQLGPGENVDGIISILAGWVLILSYRWFKDVQSI
jgi:hypothetical protein